MHSYSILYTCIWIYTYSSDQRHSHCVRCKWTLVQQLTRPLVKSDIFVDSVCVDNTTITPLAPLSSKLIYTYPLPTRILHVLAIRVTLVWSVPDCWLSAHFPKLDPSPAAPSEAQITLSNLLGQHTNTTVPLFQEQRTTYRGPTWNGGMEKKEKRSDQCIEESVLV